MSKGITGIILAGGKSQRMGVDKGLCTLQGKPMVHYSIELFSDLCDDIIICSNSQEYNRFGCKVVEDEIKNIGPMGGLHAGLKASKSEHNLVVSCDVPLLNKSLFLKMLEYADSYQLIIPKIGQFYEPLSAYYQKSVLAAIEDLILEDQRKLQNILTKVKYYALTQDEFPDVVIPEYFTNVNSPEVLKALEKLLK